ncbi:DUF421 domain-containing protein [uncultured Fibrella sp.]|uniref:DUF421 domain-containing protein n=1 Tax=uncultured Fibrella sp. TaxID=1284596 RepID=UPI0035C9AE37
MKPQEIHLLDWQRILFGNAPGEFMLETFLRSIVIYLVLTVIARLLGKRMNGQITQTETAVMLTLGAIVAPAMQLPDKGLMLSTLALTCILIFQRGIAFWGFKNSRVEQITQGRESALVKDGVLQLDEMSRCRVSKNQVTAVLRAENIYNLKKVERLYIEACGLFSVYTSEKTGPGLSTLPYGYKDIQSANLHGILESAENGIMACQHCGNTVSAAQATAECDVCHSDEWVKAVCQPQ